MARSGIGAGRLATLAAACAFVVSGASSARAQSDDPARWGARVTFSPSWTIPQRVMEIDVLADYLGPGSKVSGREFSIGVVRGRQRGGDWGLAYFRKSLSDSTRVITSGSEYCIGQNGADQCVSGTGTYTTRGAALHGAELHAFIPWFRIKERVQVGMTLGAGAMVPTGGTVTKRSEDFDVSFDPTNGQAVLTPTEQVTELDAKAFLEDLGVPTVLPTMRLELAVTGSVTPYLKVRASGGINLPGTQIFSVTAIYLFGR